MAVEDSLDIVADPVAKAACPACQEVVDVSSARPLTVAECPRCGAKMFVPGKIGQYLLLKVLGKGGMGATYKAYDKPLGRNVAIKVLRKALAANEKLVEGFFAEARALASLNHPNVVQVYTLGEQHGQPYIVMEYIGGQRIEGMFGRDKPLPEARALDIAIDVTEGLKAAGEIGLVHGDVKPANILLDEEGTAKLVDFGMAALAGSTLGPDGPLGTPYYVAPEQVRKQAMDHRTDIYSLGATLYHVLVGAPPFTGAEVKEVLDARLREPAPDPRVDRKDLHAQTAAIVTRMMEMAPDRRYQTFDELLSDLCDAYRAVGQAALASHLERTGQAIPDAQEQAPASQQAQQEAPDAPAPAGEAAQAPASKNATPKPRPVKPSAERRKARKPSDKNSRAGKQVPGEKPATPAAGRMSDRKLMTIIFAVTAGVMAAIFLALYLASR